MVVVGIVCDAMKSWDDSLPASELGKAGSHPLRQYVTKPKLVIVELLLSEEEEELP